MIAVEKIIRFVVKGNTHAPGDGIVEDGPPLFDEALGGFEIHNLEHPRHWFEGKCDEKRSEERQIDDPEYDKIHVVNPDVVRGAVGVLVL